MSTIRTEWLKRAILRDLGIPVGQPARLSLRCVCGAQLDMGMSNEAPRPATCGACGARYNSRGYIL